VKETYEKQHYFGLYGMQAEKLHDDEKQAHHAKPSGNEEILQVLPRTQTAQRNQVAEN
jgi:hypothetical protein